MFFTDVVTPDMYHFPKRHFLVMGVLDSLGTFFTCLGAPYTPGSVTPLLNQLLIPFTMSVSRTLLGVRYRWRETSGAVLIVIGACLSVVPSIVTAQSSEVRWYAVVFYALSNCPMAMSACYKESKFEERQLDVWYLTQWVSIFQFLVSFTYMPLQMLPGFGSADGMPAAEIPKAFADGFWCYMELIPECADVSAFLLLTGYCGVNVCFNTLGLYLTKHGSAVLQALSYSMLLPFTTGIFFTPLLGSFREPLTSTSAFTVVGLLAALTGFGIYQRYARGLSSSPMPVTKDEIAVIDEELCAALLVTSDKTPTLKKGQPSFQERVIGMGHASGQYGISSDEGDGVAHGG
jgi:hypothetical protein